VARADLTIVLDQAGARYELVSHAHTETAIAEAKALGVSPAEVAKTLIVKTLSGYVRAVLPASERLDLSKLSALCGGAKKTVQLATEEDLNRDYPEFELGAVPPLGGAHRDSVVVDRRLAEQESLVLEAGSHDESVRIATADLLRIAEAQLSDICDE